VVVITRLEIENFKAIRKVAIDLTPLTVFVGPNDSGKSTILQALALLERCVFAEPHARPTDVFTRAPVEYFRDHDASLTMRIAVAWTTGDANDRWTYELHFGVRYDGYVGVTHEALDGPDFGWKEESPFPGITRLSRDVRQNASLDESVMPLITFLASFDAARLSSPSAAVERLHSDGFGLPGVIDQMLTAIDRRPLQRFEQGLRKMSRYVQAVATRPLSDGRKELWFSRGDGVGFAASEASNGILLTAGYLALLHGSDYRCFLVEEPENGVHPHVILAIVDVLREISRGGKQVLLTTHSPVLLGYMQPADVRVVTRSQAEGVKVTPMFDTRYFNELTQKMDLGELWYSIDEEALVSTAS
jgi:energy-coupling factor transporter ATP-binding protein EcfA2